MAFFVCPNCDHTQDAPDEYVGRTAKCLKCETKGEILDRKPTPKPPPPKPTVVPKPKIKPEIAGVHPDQSRATVVRPTSAISQLQGRVMIGLLAGLLIAQIFGLTSTRTSTTEWEYAIESPSDSTFQLALDRLGGEGWELVFARRATSEFGSPSYEMILKRPKK